MCIECKDAHIIHQLAGHGPKIDQPHPFRFDLIDLPDPFWLRDNLLLKLLDPSLPMPPIRFQLTQFILIE